MVFILQNIIYIYIYIYIERERERERESTEIKLHQNNVTSMFFLSECYINVALLNIVLRFIFFKFDY